MAAFVDETRIEVRSGDGGSGCVSFRREKYVPRGGPDGGDGGSGGDVVFVTRRNLSTLSHLRGKPQLHARNGSPGKGKRMHGKDGADLEIFVPPGTRIRDEASGALLHDFSADIEGERWVGLAGGRGGLGNWHFRSSRRQAPRFGQPGTPGETALLHIELSLIADIGLVGLPSSGKSSLINALTSANSKVGAYPFTTKIPHLGILRRGDAEVVIADIPGLIEGASEGAGLGHRFLRHVGRTTALVYLVDLGEEYPERAVVLLEEELSAYDSALTEKSRLVVGSKRDRDGAAGRLIGLRKAFPKEEVRAVSVFNRDGLDQLEDALFSLKAPPAEKAER